MVSIGAGWVEGSLCTSSSTDGVRLWHNFSKNCMSNEDTSHHLGLNSSTATEPKILGLLQLLLMFWAKEESEATFCTSWVTV